MAKFRIRHGVEVDAATPGEVAAIVQKALDNTASESHHREKGAIALDANGAGQSAFGVSRSYNWMMERITIGGTGAVNALVAIFSSDSGSDADMLEIIQLGTAGRYSDGFANNLWIPAGNRVVITVTGGVAGKDVTYNFQVKMIPVPA